MQCKVTKIINLLLIVLTCFTLLFFFGCNDGANENSTDDNSWTLLIYMCGSTLESRSGEASKNIKEMLQAEIPENANVVIQTGGARSWKTDGISASSTDRFIIENNNLTLVDRIITKQNFAESSTLTNFITFGLTNYPADHTALILWDHGGGSLSGVCFDENFGMDGLTLTELDTALKDADIATKFEFIGFDACLMATYETASVIAPYANYLVASEEKEPSGGWNYAELLNSLSTENFYNNLLTSYAQKSAKKYYTLSVTDLGGMPKIDDMITALTKKMITEGKREIVNGINFATSFGLAGSGLYDLGNLFEYYGIEGDYSRLITCVNSSNRSDATGLSIYFPLYTNTYLTDYLTLSTNSDYNSLLNYFVENSNESIEFVNYAEETDGKLSFTLTQSSMEYFAQAEYMLFAIENVDGIQENVYLLGNDTDVVVEGNKLTISFEGRWVEFGGNMLSCIVVDKVGNYTTYQAPVLVNDEEAILLFGYDATTKTTDIIGVTFSADDYGRIYPLNEGDSVLVIKRHYD
jgi:hypothetical protein